MKRDIHFYHQVLENLIEGLVITDLFGRIEYVNSAFSKVTGYSLDEVKGKNPNILKSDYHSIDFYNQMWQSVVHTGKWEGEIWNKRKNGEVYLEHLLVTELRDLDGNTTHYLGVFSDITIRRKMENSLWQSNQALQALIEASPIGIITLDQNKKVTMWNPAAEDIFGWKEQEVLHTPYPLVPEGKEEEFAKIFDDVIKRNKTYTGLEVQRITRDGFLKWVSLSTSRLVDAQNNNVGFIAMFKDITENKLAEAKINFLAFHDELTSLPNRRALKERIDEAIIASDRKQISFSVMFIDIDHFKKVNDSIGHQFGDNLLISLSERIQSCLKKSDQLFRIGGDEFAAFLHGIGSEQEVSDIAQKIIDTVEIPIIHEGYEFHLSCSIGITIYPTDGPDTETLMVNADTAMYRVKDRGSKYQFYNPSMNESAHERIILENDLYRALERNEFELFYQPQVHVGSGELVGAEALIRWNHPKWGLIPPAQFIPLAEETGLIIPIGEWVMKTACTQTLLWNSVKKNNPLTMAVNLSSRQFMKHDLVSSVKKALAGTGCDPAFLELEITESMAMDIGHAMSILKDLKELGVKIGMDDFGTGYSSLSYLKRLPIDKLKIDQSFLRELEEDTSDAAIVATIIAMAHNLHLKVTAEGVETDSQYQFLLEHQCDEAQGYLFSRPLSSNDFTRKYIIQR